MANPKFSLQEMATILRSSERLGAVEDKPEGTRCCRFSETLAIDMADSLDAIIAGPGDEELTCGVVINRAGRYTFQDRDGEVFLQFIEPDRVTIL